MAGKRFGCLSVDFDAGGGLIISSNVDRASRLKEDDGFSDPRAKTRYTVGFCFEAFFSDEEKRQSASFVYATEHFKILHGKFVSFVDNDESSRVFARFVERRKAGRKAVRPRVSDRIADVAEQLYLRTAVHIEHIRRVFILLNVPCRGVCFSAFGRTDRHAD